MKININVLMYGRTAGISPYAFSNNVGATQNPTIFHLKRNVAIMRFRKIFVPFMFTSAF